MSKVIESKRKLAKFGTGWELNLGTSGTSVKSMTLMAFGSMALAV